MAGIGYGQRLMYGQFVIYALLDPGSLEVRYIGKSVSGLTRPMQHGNPSTLLRDRRSRWLRALQKRGQRCLVVILESLPSKQQLNEAEVRWIAEGRAVGWRLTNITHGGDGGGRVWTAAERAEQSQRMRGKRKSLAHRQALGEAFRRRRASEETKAKMRATALRRTADPAERQRLATLRLGAKNSPEHRAKLRAVQLGRVHSAERRARNSAARRGRPLPERTKAKMSEAQRQRWAQRRAVAGAQLP